MSLLFSFKRNGLAPYTAPPQAVPARMLRDGARGPALRLTYVPRRADIGADFTRMDPIMPPLLPVSRDGITPEVDPEHAGAFIGAVRELSEPYHR